MINSIFKVAKDTYVAYDNDLNPISFSNSDMTEFTYYDEI
jgi:hypothetical protein